jgi:diguanylate cyclase (GGDEF)-like protein
LSKPDFRAVAAGRLRAERNKSLSRSVLRLLSIEDEPLLPPDAVDDLPAHAVERATDRPVADREAEARNNESRRGAGSAWAWMGSLDETDPASGLFSAGAWARVLHNEEDRYARHARPVTVVVAEVDGFDSLAATVGDAAAGEIASSVAVSARRSARGGDVLARTGRARFAGLLPETDEIAAVNFVERLRSECDEWLDAHGLPVRLAIGWAQPPAGQGLAEALGLADDRMNADRRRRDRRTTTALGDGVNQ